MIWVLVFSVAFAAFPARFLTLEATTTNPLPASPARAAPMAAFSANKFVCSAMSLISLGDGTMLIDEVEFDKRIKSFQTQVGGTVCAGGELIDAITIGMNI